MQEYTVDVYAERCTMCNARVMVQRLPFDMEYNFVVCDACGEAEPTPPEGA